MVTSTGAALCKGIPVRLEGMLWEVDCRGMVTIPNWDETGKLYHGNVNVANPGNIYTDIARKAFKAVCRKSYD